LSADNKKQIFIPASFAHGYCVPSDVAEFEYKRSEFYSPKDERGILWNDPTLNIKWPVEQPILSEKDQKNPSFKEIERNLHHR
jgi:dTDP-4-dehydrorhamnose 3,5-epimerase